MRLVLLSAALQNMNVLTWAYSPSCALNGLPCAPPNWEPSWNLTRSTVIQPRGDYYFIPGHPWGLISLDWSVANHIWYKGDVSNTTCEATSIAGCRLLKAAGLAHRCFIYHNMELALQWLESQRRVMYDSAYSGFFLHRGGDPTAPIYNEPITFGDQYFWDYRNVSAAEYFVSATLSVIEDPAVDGTFSDDVDGVPGEHPAAPAATGLGEQALADLRFATAEASSALIAATTAAGKYNWQAFGTGDGVQGGFGSSTCASWMRTHCDVSYQGRPMLMAMDNDPTNDRQFVAAFLIARPPHAYLGWGWESDDKDWNDLFYLQVGEPLGLCAEGPSGVFSRPYTLGTAGMNCNNYTATLPFSPLWNGKLFKDRSVK